MKRLLRATSRRRVAFLVFNLDGMGGTSRSAITQANALTRRGNVGVEIVSVTRSARAPHYEIDPRVNVTYLADIRNPNPGHDRPSRLVPHRWDSQFSAFTDEAIRAGLPKIAADILITVTPALMSLAVQFTRPGTRILHQEHRSSADRVGGMEPLLAFAPRVAAVALLTESTRDWLADQLGTIAPPLVVMPNPLPIGEQPRSPLDQKTIMAAGRIVQEKQYIHLLRAFEAADLPDWKVKILGDGPLRKELRAHAVKAGIGDRVRLPGSVPSMAPEWAKATICVLSSKTEGFPLGAQEAMAAGVPVISYDCPSGPRELVHDGVSGLLVGPDSKAGLAAAIRRLAGDSALLTRLGDGAYHASRAYDPDLIAARWESIFEQVLTDSLPTPPGQPFSRVLGPAPLVTPEAARAEALSLILRCAGDEAWVIPAHGRPAPTVVVPRDRQREFLRLLGESAPPHFALRDPGDRGWPERRDLPDAMADHLRNAAPNRLVLETWPRTQGRTSHLAEGAQVEVEFWDREGSDLVASRPNDFASRLSVGDITASTTVAGVEVRTHPLMVGPIASEVAFPVDVVYTWVDGDDPAWNAARDAREGSDAARESAGAARFRTRDELRYSLRSIEMFAPWVRTIHIVTAGQRPDWLADHPRIRLVDHRDILPAEALPTFNSQAIETALHRIPDLAEHFIYVNDDVFLGRPLRPESFFSPGGDFAAFVGEGTIGVPGADAKPFLQAAANNRRLLQESLGVTITHVMAHTPHPHRVSVLSEIEARFGEEVAATARAPFRSSTDVSMLSSLAQHYGLATGSAFRGHLQHAFVDLSNARVERQLRQLRARTTDVFCIGDHHDFALDTDKVDATLAEFLADYFPVPGPWER